MPGKSAFCVSRCACNGLLSVNCLLVKLRAEIKLERIGIAAQGAVAHGEHRG